MTYYLNKSFDITEQLIKDNPQNENEIINNFNNYIISTNNSYKNNPMVRSATYNDNELPLDINIHNNFQRYNNKNNDDMNDDGYFMSNKMNYNITAPAPPAQPPAQPPAPAVQTPAQAAPAVQTPAQAAPAVQTPAQAAPAVQTPAQAAPVATPEKFKDYFKDLRYGFKDYFSFN